MRLKIIVVCGLTLSCLSYNSNSLADERMLLSCTGEYVGVVTRSIRSVTQRTGRPSGAGTAVVNGNGTTVIAAGQSPREEQTISVQEERREDSTILIEAAEDGWIQIPSTMLPTLQKVFKKKANKWSFKNFEMTDEEISGKFNFNILNKPVFTVSRITGAMDMNIYGATFKGACKKLDRDKTLF